MDFCNRSRPDLGAPNRCSSDGGSCAFAAAARGTPWGVAEEGGNCMGSIDKIVGMRGVRGSWKTHGVVEGVSERNKNSHRIKMLVGS